MTVLLKPAPGSFLWLLAHDLRLNWRGLTAMFGRAKPRLTGLVLAGCAALLHLLAWPVVAWLAPSFSSADASQLPMIAGVGAVFTWMIAQSVFGTTRTLYDRADLDLLLGSPLPAARVIAAKALAIMASTLGSIAIFVIPLANMGALIDGPAWLGIYPALIGLALIATSIGLGVTMVLFLGVGPRRARVYAHMTGAGLGGAFVLGAQVYAVLPPATIDAIAAWFERAGLMPSAQAQTWLTWPIDAVRGDVTAMALLLALGTLVFAATITLLGERFARAAMVARGAPTPGSATRDPRPIRFRTGAGRNLRAKEWRLLARDPSLFAQLGLQIIYTIPVAVILLRSDVVPMAFAIVPTIVVIAAQVAGSIAWITVSGEDAPELIATAPVTMPAVERAKLSAVAMPVLIILALPLIGLALADLYLAIMAFAFAALAGTSTALLNFWHPMPGNRRGMLRRHSQSKLIGLVEHGLAMLWAVAAVFAVAGHWAVLVPLAMVAGILACAVKRRLPKPALPMVAPAAVEA